jgi:Outer membrane protein beta-barrel domain
MLMKKQFLILIACLPFWGMAQTRVAVRSGINLASIRFYDFNPPKRSIPRLNIGLMVEIPLEDNWLLYTGPYYSGKGVRFGRTTSTNRVDSFTIRLNYIELPLNVAYRFDSYSQNNLIIAAGPYISYGFNGEISVKNSPQPPTTQLHKKKTDQYKRLDMGLCFSSIYEIKSKYGVRLEYSKSLFNIQRVGKEKNNVIGFSFFWYLGKNEKEEND